MWQTNESKLILKILKQVQDDGFIALTLNKRLIHAFNLTEKLYLILLRRPLPSTKGRDRDGFHFKLRFFYRSFWLFGLGCK
ncbi:hypothetical protein A8B79_15785 [Balneola sp. EhC07]|nr:hypothetical protein A8B79_15785 [Balneola sp. EhC07]